MPSLLLRHFRFNIPFLLFRLSPDSVFRFLHIPRAIPEAVLPPIPYACLPFSGWRKGASGVAEEPLPMSHTGFPVAWERLFGSMKRALRCCGKAFPAVALGAGEYAVCGMSLF